MRLGLDNDVTGVSGGDAAVGGEVTVYICLYLVPVLCGDDVAARARQLFPMPPSRKRASVWCFPDLRSSTRVSDARAMSNLPTYPGDCRSLRVSNLPTYPRGCRSLQVSNLPTYLPDRYRYHRYSMYF